MPLAGITLLLTRLCNFSCPYCYQEKGNGAMAPGLLDESLRRFHPRMKKSGFVALSGGEPLLAWAGIERAVEKVRRLDRRSGKKTAFSLTTNGSLLGRAEADFFLRHHFQLLLSWDGSAQEKRSPGSGPKLEKVVEILKGRAGLEWEVNATFTPETVGEIVPSLRQFLAEEVPAFTLSFNTDREWGGEALRALSRALEDGGRMLALHAQRSGRFPCAEFQPVTPPALFACGGHHRIAVEPDGTVWSCHLFAEAFRRTQREWIRERFAFGTLREFTSWPRGHVQRVRRTCRELRQDRFYTRRTECASCPELLACSVCPADALLAGAVVPETVPAWTCRLRRIEHRARRRFVARLENRLPTR